MSSPYDQLAEFHRLLEEKASLYDALLYVAEGLKKMLSAERASLLIYDREEEQLWTRVLEQDEKVLVPFDQGIVGDALRTGRVQLENEPYDNPNFFAEVDMQLGFYTQSILAAPVFDAQNQVIGVIELLNKPGGFTKADREFITHFANSISGFIEESTLK